MKKKPPKERDGKAFATYMQELFRDLETARTTGTIYAKEGKETQTERTLDVESALKSAGVNINVRWN